MHISFRVRAVTLGLVAAAIATGGVLLHVETGRANLLIGTPGNDVLIGKDDDTTDNPAIQPAGVMADQSLKKADLLFGMEGDDLLIGLLGDDFLDGGPGDDVLVGGTEQGMPPNSDIQNGGEGNDVSVWAGGDGGGPGVDAIVFAVIDRDGANVPTAQMATVGRSERPIATANLLGAPGFCQIDRAPEDSGYEWLVRFVVRNTGAVAVTVRLYGVEQVFCSSKMGGGAEWVDFTQGSYGGGDLRPITLERIREVNPLVGAIVR
jgi:hypothetical protein